MIKNLKYAFLISFAAILILLIISYLNAISFHLSLSILIAALITTMNFILFVFSFNYSFKKSNNIFLIFTLGGIGVRLLLMLALVFISIKFLKVDKSGFIFAFFLWYIFYLMYEISVVKLKLKQH